MSVTEDLNVAYHQQDTNYYCGGACAQMVLDQIGAGLLSQDDLYNENHAHSTAESGWATGPDGLQFTMNDRRPAAFHNWFALFALANEDSISRKLCWTIHHYQVAPIALVYGYQHWIVIRGYDASAAPSSSGDNSYTITGFEVNNPWPPTPMPGPPPPHAVGDGCGTGGNRGIADEHISYAQWQATYMTGVPAGHWAGQFVAVCDPEQPAAPPRLTVPFARRFDGARVLTRDEALRLALESVSEFKLAERKRWQPALANVKAQPPLLVQRLDHADSFYYIVPLGATPDRATAGIVLDARYGHYLESVALPEGGSSVIGRLDPKGARELILNQRFELENFAGRVLVRPDVICACDTLVWKPCLESLSPFFPFYQFTAGGATVYVRVDGAVFTALHDAYRGL
jgi:hypothetical protein